MPEAELKWISKKIVCVSKLMKSQWIEYQRISMKNEGNHGDDDEGSSLCIR